MEEKKKEKKKKEKKKKESQQNKQQTKEEDLPATRSPQDQHSHLKVSLWCELEGFPCGIGGQVEEPKRRGSLRIGKWKTKQKQNKTKPNQDKLIESPWPH
jgi:hypothetical protein